MKVSLSCKLPDKKFLSNLFVGRLMTRSFQVFVASSTKFLINVFLNLHVFYIRHICVIELNSCNKIKPKMHYHVFGMELMEVNNITNKTYQSFLFLQQ